VTVPLGWSGTAFLTVIGNGGSFTRTAPAQLIRN
jgi:hypothetical protein